MNDRVPTVTVKSVNGPVEVNMTDYMANQKSDENPNGYELDTTAPVAPAPVVEAPVAPAQEPAAPAAGDQTPPPVVLDPSTFTVGKNGKRGAASKSVIVDAEGNQVGTEEYETEADAQAAIALLVEQHAAQV